MATSRTRASIEAIIAVSQCCFGDLMYKILKKKRHLQDHTCDLKNAKVIKALYQALFRYTPGDVNNNLTDAEAERIIENIYELCGCLNDYEPSDESVETEIPFC